jgi:hypothetical protein
MSTISPSKSGLPSLEKVNTSPRKKKWGIFSPGKNTDINDLTPEEQKEMIEKLKNTLAEKQAEEDSLKAKTLILESEMKRSSIILQRKHPLNNESHHITDDGNVRKQVATRGSIATDKILRSIGDPQKSPSMILAERFLSAFQKPLEYMAYLQSRDFANDLIEMCDAVCEILEGEARCVFLQSPVYVFGDIHGNLEDLHFFSDNLWKLGMDITAGRFLFLGDYVDRGLNCLECIAYLFGLKVLCPNKITLLR